MALQNLVTELVLDIYDHDKAQSVMKSIALDDNTRYVRARLEYMGITYSIDASSNVTLYVLRPDKAGVEVVGQTYTYEGEDDTSYYGAYAELDQAALAVAGTVLGQFKIESGTQKLRTEVFKINNGRALDGETSEWAGEYQGYDLSEFAATIANNTDRQTAVEGRMTALEEEWDTEMEGLIGDVRDNLRKAVKYPVDTEDQIILPVAPKILVIEPEGTGNYEDIPYGNVVKGLLFDSFDEDDSKTKVSITINTSGTPVTGEVQNLRNTMRVLYGDTTAMRPTKIGGIGTTSNGLWYVGQNISIAFPVTPGHTYKFAAKTPTQEDSWYATTGVYFSPGFDFDFATAYVQIPNTEGAIAFDPVEHSDDGRGKLFNGSGLVVPEGMNYVFFNVTQQFRESGQEDNIRDFGMYDYTEFPTDATYDKIVDDPVIGNVYNIAYSLIRATSSNNATTVGGSSQYKTVITADQGKVISACNVKVGNRVYEPVDGEITINGSASNIKITAASEDLPDDTYVGRFEVKPDLIPARLLESKLDTPTGFSRATAGQMLYADGTGGLIIADAPFVPNRKFDTKWEPVFSHYAGGYMYDPSDDYAYTQIGENETMWQTQTLRLCCSCTPFDDLVPVTQGERYRYQMTALRLDRINQYLPGFIIFDSNKEVLQVVEVESTQGGTVYPEFVIPKGGVWMAIHYYNAQHFIVEKEVVKTFDKFDMLSAINANYRSYLRGNAPIKKTLDKAYICVGTDDIRSHQTKRLHDMFTAKNMPYYMAAIPEAVKVCIQDDPYKTNKDYMDMCVAAGGEIVCHSDEWIRADNIDDFDTLYKYFCTNKKELEFYGFDIHGLFKAGGSGGISDADPRMDAWATYFYDFTDTFGYTFPYRWMNRRFLEYLGTNSVANYIQNAINNRSYEVFITHEYTTTVVENVNQIAATLSGYTRGVDYDFITPYELYKKVMPVPEQE